MTTDLLTALVAFIFVMSITPGPNNALLLASGLNFGFRRTLPQMFGVSFGGAFMMLLLGFGVGQIFSRFPVLYDVLRVFSILYMLWLAWHIASAGLVLAGGNATDPAQRPMTFLQSCAFQWVNPKAWTMCLTAVSAFTVPGQYAFSLAVVVGAFVLVNAPSISVWTIFGVTLRGLLSDPRRVRAFNIVMALALLASLWPVVAEFWH